MTKLLVLIADVVFELLIQNLFRCQTYEGGIGGCHGVEAHGGYTFCGFAALVILNHAKLIDSDKLLKWVVSRQMAFEGGFQVKYRFVWY